MSDSFAAIWNSSAPAKSPQPPPKLGASPAPSLGAPRPKYDAFTMLAASGSNSSSPHSLTPSTSAAPVRRSNGSAAPTTSGDAFSDLLSGSFGSNPNNAKLSIAERARAQTQVTQKPTVPLQNTSAWAGLDSLAGSSFSSSQPSKPTSPQIDDDWLFGSSTSSAQAELASAPKPQVDDWGLADFVSHTKPSNETHPEPSFKGGALWDLDDFRSSSDQDQGVSPSTHNLPPPRSNTPGDFDFGDRENALLGDDSGSDDDVLVDVGRPMHERPTRRPSPPVCSIFLKSQKYANFLTIPFPGCCPGTQHVFPATSSCWPDCRDGILS
jgi:hypothetical protein